MNRKWSLSVLLLLMGVALCGVQYSGAAEEEKLTGSKIVWLSQTEGEEQKPIKLKQDEIVRIEGGGIAGATVTAKVTGPAKAVKNKVRRLVNGQMMIGAAGDEFEVKSTGKGKVKVEVTVKNPTSPDPIVTTYEYTVE